MTEITSPILFDAAVHYADETEDASIRGDLRIAFVAGAEWQWKRDADLSAENARLRKALERVLNHPLIRITGDVEILIKEALGAKP